MFRPPSASFDSMLRGRYFPGGPTPDGLDSDIMFKQLGDSVDPFQARNRRDSEEMVTDNRCRKYPGSRTLIKTYTIDLVSI